MLVEQQNHIATKEVKPRISTNIDELLAFCPKCTALETLYFSEEGLTPTRKFTQTDGHIYHDCGSSKPCHLYRIF